MGAGVITCALSFRHIAVMLSQILPYFVGYEDYNL